MSKPSSSLIETVGLQRRNLSRGKAVVIENFFALSVVQVANYLFPLITVPYLLRVVGIGNYGLIAFAQSLIQYFVTFTDYGFNLSATRDVSVHREDKKKLSEIFVSVMVIKIALMAFSFLLLCVLLAAVPKFQKEWLLYLFTFGQVIGMAASPYWFFQGMERMRYITFLNFADKLIFTLALFVFIHRPGQYLYVPLLTSLGFVSAGLIGLGLAFKLVKVSLGSLSYRGIVQQLRNGWHVFISTVSVSAYTTTRTFAIGIFTTPAITGAYALAEKLMYIVQTFPLASLVQAAYPRLSSMYARSREESYRVMRRLQNYTTVAYLVVMPAAWWLAPFIIRIIAGAPIREATLVFRILLVAILCINSNAFRVQFLLVAGMERVYSRIHLVSSLAGIVLVFGGAHLYSYWGPPTVLIGIELLVLTLTIYYLRKADILGGRESLLDPVGD